MAPTGPESLSEILARLFTQRGWGRPQQQLHIEEMWRQAAGEEIAARTQAVAVKRGILEVHVADGVLLQELASFQKQRLIAELQRVTAPGAIKDLRFRLRGQG
jgi:predicted nucleic acid-binding Zn ribbon protein